MSNESSSGANAFIEALRSTTVIEVYAPGEPVDACRSLDFYLRQKAQLAAGQSQERSNPPEANFFPGTDVYYEKVYKAAVGPMVPGLGVLGIEQES